MKGWGKYNRILSNIITFAKDGGKRTTWSL